MFDEKCQKQQELWRAFGLGWQTHFLRWIYHTHREHTHTDQYLNFDGHHHLGHKKSVVKTIFCCFNTVISKEEDRTQEIEHLKSILHDSNYKVWLWKILEKEREKQRAAQNRTAMHPKCRSPLRTRYAPSTSRVWTPTMCFEKQLSFLIGETFIQPLKFNEKFLWWANAIFFTATWVSLSCCLKHSLPVIMRLQ